MDNYIFNNVNENCYHFKTIKNKNGLYDSFVDMTYVLIMENSEREKHVYDQLEKFQPTKTVKVQYNKGYKKCKKQLCDNKANWDLFDAHYNVHNIMCLPLMVCLKLLIAPYRNRHP